MITRTLLADTGGGSRNALFEFILSDSDCRRFGRPLGITVRLGRAISGSFPTYSVWVEIPGLSFARQVVAVGVPAAQLPPGLDGIAGFRFLNSFNYGNFANPDQFCLETL
jgi:hypothetical protein